MSLFGYWREFKKSDLSLHAFSPLGAGYTIPAGWAVMVCPPAVHLNPEIYEDPLAFNPWRWQVCVFDICASWHQLCMFHFGCELNLRDSVC